MTKTRLHFDAVVVGLGKTGLSCVRYLIAQGKHVAVTDSRLDPPALDIFKKEFSGISTYLGDISEEALFASEKIILSPGLALNQPVIKRAIEKGIAVMGDIELFCQAVKAPIIAISGSNGKSTVTILVREMIKRAGHQVEAGGNLGTPALELLGHAIPEIYVLELSSFQLETTFSLNAHASVVLNLSPDHMDRYDDLAAYAKTKRKIYSGQGVMVINKSDPNVGAMADTDRSTIYFTASEPQDGEYGLRKKNGVIWLCLGVKEIIADTDILIKGEHNLCNALAAMAIASTFGISQAAMIDTLKTFSGLPHRCQLVKKRDGVSWYNDSKATNVGACIASILGLYQYGRIILIAGGDSKGADLSSLIPIVGQHVKHAYLLGVDAKKLASVFADHCSYSYVNDMQQAVCEANALSTKGDIVLLAPACASLDMYKDYQHRGDAFVEAVNSLEAA